GECLDNLAILVAAVSRLFERTSKCRHLADFTAQIADAVEQVNTDVKRWAAAGQDLDVAPGRVGHCFVRRPLGRTNSNGGHELRDARAAPADRPPGGAGRRLIAHVFGNAKCHPVSPTRLDHRARRSNAYGKWLLDEAVNPAIHRAD